MHPTFPDQQRKAIVFFDGVCNLCERSVQFIISHDPAGFFHFAALQSEAGRKALAAVGAAKGRAPDSVILFKNGNYYTESSAALQIARHLKGGWKLLALLRFIPRFLRDPLYRLLARNRYRWFGKKPACWLPTPALKERFL